MWKSVLSEMTFVFQSVQLNVELKLQFNLIIEPLHEKTNKMHIRKQRRRADQRICFRYTDSTMPQVF